MFPFIFANQSHAACTMADSVNGLAWCATEVEEATGEAVAGRWSDCRSESCPVECICPEGEAEEVCGTDGATYSSGCEARCGRAAVDHPGPCLARGEQCRFNQDCDQLDRCSARPDASCACSHGTCEPRVTPLPWPATPAGGGGADRRAGVRGLQHLCLWLLLRPKQLPLCGGKVQYCRCEPHFIV